MIARLRIPRGAARFGIALAAVAAAGLLVASLSSPEAAWRAWYFGAYFGLHVSLGCAALLFIGDLTGGRWSEQLVPLLDAGRRAIYLMLPLFALSFANLDALFPWASNAGPEESLFPLSKDAYLSPPLFAARALLYAAAFALIARWSGVSARNIRCRSHGERRSTTKAGCGGLVLHAFVSIPFQADAVMSLEPHWYSTAFPLAMMASQALAAYSLCLAARGLLLRRGQSEEPYFGNLLLATMLFWLYVAFAQFLIIWMGNLSHDIGYYLHRSKPLWIAASGTLAVFSFALPLLALLRPEVKLRSTPLGAVAAMLAAGQLLYVAWAMLPSWEPRGAGRALLCGLSGLGFVGLWASLALPQRGREAANG